MSRIAVIIKEDRFEKGYGIFGDSSNGFGVKIQWREDGKPAECCRTPRVFFRRDQALSLMQQLIRSDVHPTHLLDIVRDHLLEQYWDLSPSFDD